MFAKFTKVVLGVVALCVVGLCGQAKANTLVIQVTLTGSGYSDPGSNNSNMVNGNGGPFSASSSNTPAQFTSAGWSFVGGNSFTTFCVETTEDFSPGSTYYVDPNAQSEYTGDVLAAQTSWLYAEYRNGTLGTATSGQYTNTQTGNVALQEAIWYFQQQKDKNGTTITYSETNSLAQTLITDANSAFGLSSQSAGVSAASKTSSVTNYSNVQILNVWTTNQAMTGPGVQDQLALVSYPGQQQTSTPLPASVYGGSALLSLLGSTLYFNRRRRDQSAF